MFRSLVVASLSLSAAYGHAATVGAGQQKEVSARRTAAPVRLDGRLDEAAWSAAKPASGFTQRFPEDGAKPNVRTEIRVLFDNDNIYFGVTSFDPEPAKIMRRLSRRDRDVVSDYVEIILDPRHDHDTGFLFRVTASGVLADSQLHDDTRSTREWDAVWRGKAALRADGWTAELEIPLSILRFPEQEDHRWGLNVTRFVGRTRETLQWVHIAQNEPGQLTRAGHIVGIGGLAHPTPLELRPFVVFSADAEFPTGGVAGVGRSADRGLTLNAGLDARVGIGSELTLDLSVNPDFGQVEADEVILNLSRFEAFFPEKRPFFQERADLFNTDIRLFYSRRIGFPSSNLSPGADVEFNGEDQSVVAADNQVPIWVAGRPTGRLSDRVTIAGLAAVLGPERATIENASGEQTRVDATPPRLYAAARAKVALGGTSSYLGFLATSRTNFGDAITGVDNHDSYAQSIDGRWVAKDGRYRAFFHVAASQRVGGEESRRVDGVSFGPGDSGFAAEMGGGQFRAAHWTAFARYRVATRRFDVQDVGFENDWDYHKGFAQLRLREQNPFGPFQNGDVSFIYDTSRATDYTHRNSSYSLSSSLLWRSFWLQEFEFAVRPRNTFSIRETFDGARFERASLVQAGALLSTDTRRNVRGVVSARPAGSVDDDVKNYAGQFDFVVQPRPALELTLSAGLSISDNDLRFVNCTSAGGSACSPAASSRDYLFAELDSATLSLTNRVDWAITPNLSIQSYLQVFSARGRYHDYESITGQLGAKPSLRRSEFRATGETGDRDGDGISDDNFGFSNLAANLVFRWEIWPGTTLIAVYTRAKDASSQLLDERPRLSFGRLRGSRTEEVALLKFTLFL